MNRKALLTETKVESGTSRTKSGTSVESSECGEPRARPHGARIREQVFSASENSKPFQVSDRYDNPTGSPYLDAQYQRLVVAPGGKLEAAGRSLDKLKVPPPTA